MWSKFGFEFGGRKPGKVGISYLAFWLSCCAGAFLRIVAAGSQGLREHVAPLCGAGDAGAVAVGVATTSISIR